MYVYVLMAFFFFLKSSWILYRSDIIKSIKTAQEEGKPFPIPENALKKAGVTEELPSVQGDVSKMIALLWKNETKTVMKKYNELSVLRKQEVSPLTSFVFLLGLKWEFVILQHAAVYPDYKFKPNKVKASLPSSTKPIFPLASSKPTPPLASSRLTPPLAPPVPPSSEASHAELPSTKRKAPKKKDVKTGQGGKVKTKKRSTPWCRRSRLTMVELEPIPSPPCTAQSSAGDPCWVESGQEVSSGGWVMPLIGSMVPRISGAAAETRKVSVPLILFNIKSTNRLILFVFANSSRTCRRVKKPETLVNPTNINFTPPRLLRKFLPTKILAHLPLYSSSPFKHLRKPLLAFPSLTLTLPRSPTRLQTSSIPRSKCPSPSLTPLSFSLPQLLRPLRFSTEDLGLLLRFWNKEWGICQKRTARMTKWTPMDMCSNRWKT